MKTAKELIKTLRAIDETTTIEAKECSKKVDKSVLESICAFANEPDLGGGYIILGLHVDNTKSGADRYTVVGVENPDKLQNDITSQCSTVFNRRIIVHTQPEIVEGKTVIIIHVPEAEKSAKPYYFANKGFPKGAFRRLSGSDQECDEDDIPVLYAKSDDYDKGIVDDATLDDIDDNALRRYRELRAKVNANAEELTYNDTDLLKALGCIKRNKEGEWRLTITGLLVFGKTMSLRRTYPMVRADYIRIPGTRWVDDPDTRFETIDMRGPMILLVNRIFNAIVDDLPRQFALTDGETQASTQIKIPEKALREAIVNALIHRSYRINRPLQIIRYSNRIEIINPGYSLKPEESLGEPGSNLRNQMISAIFHDTNLAETKGSGMKSMRLLMNKAKILPPTYESNHGKNQFTLRILLHQLFGAEDMEWLKNYEKYNLTNHQTIAIIFLKEVKAIDMLTYRQLTGLKTSGAKADIGNLLNTGLITAKGKGNKTYYIPSELAVSYFQTTSVDRKTIPPISKDGISDAEKTVPQAEKPKKDGTSDAEKTVAQAEKPKKDGTSDAEKTVPIIPDNRIGTIDNWILPIEMINKIENLKKWERIEYLKDLTEELCSFHSMSIEDIAKLINRERDYAWRKIIKPLKKEGRLSFTHPEMINHPDQRYKIGFNSKYYNETEATAK